MPDTNIPGPTLAELGERLRLAETRLLRLRFFLWGLVVLVAIAAGYLINAIGSRTIFAQRFILLDELGRNMAILGTSPAGVGLSVYDTVGRLRTDIGLSPSGTPGVFLFTPQGQTAAAINLTETGVPSVRLTDATSGAKLWLKPGSPAKDSTP